MFKNFNLRFEIKKNILDFRFIRLKYGKNIRNNPENSFNKHDYALKKKYYFYKFIKVKKVKKKIVKITNLKVNIKSNYKDGLNDSLILVNSSLSERAYFKNLDSKNKIYVMRNLIFELQEVCEAYNKFSVKSSKKEYTLRTLSKLKTYKKILRKVRKKNNKIYNTWF